MLSNRYKQTGNMDDLQAAISNVALVVSAASDGHQNNGRLLIDFAIILSDQYNRTGNIDNLQEAISQVELSVSITPKDHPNQALVLVNLANNLLD